MYKITKEYIESHTFKEIVEETGMCSNTLRTHCKRLHVKPLGRFERQIKELLGTKADYLVAKEIGVSKETICRYRKVHGIERKSEYHGKYTKEYLTELHDTYGSWAKAGKAIGVSKQCLSEASVKLGLSFDRQRYLSREEVSELMEKHKTISAASKAINMSWHCFKEWYEIYFGAKK